MSELDKTIHKIQLRSRIKKDGKIIHVEPIQERIPFDFKPSKDYNNCCLIYYNVPEIFDQIRM